MTVSTTHLQPRELAVRDGGHVQLVVAPDRTLDAFYHPFAYAA